MIKRERGSLAMRSLRRDLVSARRGVQACLSGWVAMMMLLAVSLTACNVNDIVKVKDPDVPGPTSLGGVSNLHVLLAGMVGDFENAYQGQGDENDGGGQIVFSGLLGDELGSADTRPEHNQIDQRSIQQGNQSNTKFFADLQRARSSADRVADNYAQLAPDSAGRALAVALSGFATVMLGENYCSGIPFSSIDASGNTITFGEPLPTSAVWARAIAKFDSVAAFPAADSLTTLAAIGLGRALLDSGQYDAAAVAVAAVPAGFSYLIESSANSSNEYNGVWSIVNNAQRFYVTDKEGTNGLGYRSASDPRVLYMDTNGPGFDGSTPEFVQLKYPDRPSPAPLATSAEARLIEAEAALSHSDVTMFLDRLNAARAEFTGVAPLTIADIPASSGARVDLLFRERAFDLWLTSHRLGDMRRLIRQYGRTAESVFPTGTWFTGTIANPLAIAPYGTDVNFPIPQEEENNPNFHGCLDRGA